MLTAARLREVLRYEPETGQFYWRKPPTPRLRVGDVAGGKAPSGYWRIMVDGTRYNAARLAWLSMTGVWPKHEVDHINRIADDNRWSNLREATHYQNCCNRVFKNKCGFRGVKRDSRNGRHEARIWDGKRSVHLGMFDTAEEAERAYLEAAKNRHGNFFAE